MAMIPARVMTIAMTKARRGRSMKTAEITFSAPGGGRGLARWRGCVGRRLPGDSDDLARPHFLHAVDDDLVAFLDAVLDDDVGVLGRPGGDAPLLHLVVAADHQ